MAILTLTVYKQYQKINSTNQDTELQLVINSVNDFIVSYCNRTFVDYYTNTKTEYFDATDTELYPSEYPLKSVTSVKVSTDGGETYPTTLDLYTDYAIDLKNGSVISNLDSFVTTNYPVNAIELVYNGGYAAVPNDILLAAVNLVEYYIDKQYVPSKAAAGTSLDNDVVVDSTARLPKHIRRVLEHYRAINI